MENHVNNVGRILGFIKKDGIWKTFLSVFVYGLLIFGTTYFATNAGMSVFSHNDKKEQKAAHSESMSRRMEAAMRMDRIMYDIMKDIRCDRVYIVEMHNGTNNTSGMPFLFGEMTYSRCADGIEYVDEDYSSVNLSRFTMPYYLIKNPMWMGYIDDMETIDRKLSMRMRSNSAQYAAFTTIHGIEGEIGFLGISYCDSVDIPAGNIIASTLTTNAQKISILLDKNVN